MRRVIRGVNHVTWISTRRGPSMNDQGDEERMRYGETMSCLYIMQRSHLERYLTDVFTIMVHIIQRIELDQFGSLLNARRSERIT